MDAARIAAKVSRGYGKAASIAGPVYEVYRPGDLTHPLIGAVGVVNAMFKPKGGKVGAPNTPQNPWFDGYMQTDIMEPGDIVSGKDGLYLVWNKPTLGAILAVQCNTTVSVKRPGPQVSPEFYGGAVVDVTLMEGWPASVLQGTKGETGPLGLPSDTRLGWVSILMPAPAGVTIRSSDIIVTPRARYIVASAELTDGWRIMAGLVVA
jgi:hypothetical protein